MNDEQKDPDATPEEETPGFAGAADDRQPDGEQVEGQARSEEGAASQLSPDAEDEPKGEDGV